jgi:hypothetical protein
MALNGYLQQVQRLLNNPTASLYSTADLITYINIARSQIAGEGECIRNYATLPFSIGVNQYNFSSYTTTTGAGIQGVLSVRMSQVSGSGQLMEARPWEWVNQYYLTSSNTAPTPTVWAQYGQGTLGTIFIAPTTTANGTVKSDTVCYPIALNLDSDPEAIPYPWTDCVPYFSAYLAYLNAQRDQDAQAMFQRYEMFMRRARQMSTPSVLPLQYPGSTGAQLIGQMGTPMSIGNPGFNAGLGSAGGGKGGGG